MGLSKSGFLKWISGSPVFWNGYLEFRFFQIETWDQKMAPLKVGTRFLTMGAVAKYRTEEAVQERL
jgi:hypothetical protein